MGCSFYPFWAPRPASDPYCCNPEIIAKPAKHTANMLHWLLMYGIPELVYVVKNNIKYTNEKAHTQNKAL